MRIRYGGRPAAVIPLSVSHQLLAKALDLAAENLDLATWPAGASIRTLEGDDGLLVAVELDEHSSVLEYTTFGDRGVARVWSHPTSLPALLQLTAAAARMVPELGALSNALAVGVTGPAEPAQQEAVERPDELVSIPDPKIREAIRLWNTTLLTKPEIARRVGLRNRDGDEYDERSLENLWSTWRRDYGSTMVLTDAERKKRRSS